MTAHARSAERAWAAIREPKKTGGVWYPPGSEERIARRLEALGVDVRPHAVDVADYRRFARAAGYEADFPDYYSFNRPEKSLEHYLAARLLGLGPDDVYVDIASEHSPVPQIYGKLFGVRAYRQDIAYPRGLRNDTIGGDAAHMPVPDGFATRMGLHCSFEHFEGESDVGFVREAERVLRPGGALCVVPLYLAEEYAIQTDPSMAAGVDFEPDAVVYGAAGWGNRHGRFYDPEHLVSRVLRRAGAMALRVYAITNAPEADPSCYVRFAMVLSKPGGAAPPA